MSVPLSQLLAELPEITRNSTTGALDNTKRTRGLNRTLEDLQDYADWEFTKRTKKFELIDGVCEYSLKNYIAATCKDNDGATAISDFKSPYDLRITDESHKPFSFRDVKDVRYHLQYGLITNEYGVDNDLLVINYPRQLSAQIHNCDSLTASGTVSASGNASNLTIDDVEYEEGSGALNFDANGTSLVITFSGFPSKDLEELQNKSHWTAKIWLPAIANFSSIQLEWSNDATFASKWSKTETARADGQSLEANEPNLFAFSWKEATETGSPDPSAIAYARLTITYSQAVTDTDFRIDDLRVGKTLTMKIDYYSKAMVKDTNGNYQLEFNPDDLTASDELLGPEARRTVINGGTYECFKMIGGKSERDRTDSYKEYQDSKLDLLKLCGHRLRRPSKVLNFQGRH